LTAFSEPSDTGRNPDPQDDVGEAIRDVRPAMMSVYYHSLGRELELRGAPAVMLPPEARPMPLEDALAILEKASPAKLRSAMWTLFRGAPPPRLGEDPATLPRRYPRPLRDVAVRYGDLAEFDRRRARYRAGAHLFAAALVAFAQKQYRDFEALTKLFDPKGNGGGDREMTYGFSEATAATGVLGGSSAQEYLLRLAETVDAEREERSRELVSLEWEVGLGLYTFMEEFADAVTFLEWWSPPRDEVNVHPASSVTVQDASTLTTRVTVSSLVSTRPGGTGAAGDDDMFWCLATAIDPQCWSRCSDVFRRTEYIDDAFRIAPESADRRLDRVGEGFEGSRLLLEGVHLAWAGDEARSASFENILNIDEFRVDPDARTIDLRFSLHRSIGSRVLWDERAGGILVDEGFIKARPIAPGLWRVTSRKVLRFSDRTPYSGETGWFDFGQMLNYLAPATISWWMETEMYSSGCSEILQLARERRDEAEAAS
jgi:hypothetical protein